MIEGKEAPGIAVRRKPHIRFAVPYIVAVAGPAAMTLLLLLSHGFFHVWALPILYLLPSLYSITLNPEYGTVPGGTA